MSIQYEKLERCYEYYRSIADFHPRVGLILGSGLGGYAKNMHVEKEIPYREIPDFLNEPLYFLSFYHAPACDGGHFLHERGIDGAADFFQRFTHGDDGKRNGFIRFRRG